ncbi:Ig-like domain-containing protein [Paenibacillus sp. sgz500958]|uniref:Ig-like domain-containing protein n=1 Tax=Paenibacillus sp. sgz500958 TaxID=3242475 RepID=UPI0036D2CED7
MNRRTSRWAALFLAGSLLLGNGIPYIGVQAPKAYAAVDFAITSTYPSAGQTEVGVAEYLKLNFDRTVVPVGGDVTITKQSTGTTFVSVPLTSGLLGSSTQFDVKWLSSLQFEPNTTYTVSIPAGAFKDSSGGNSLAASWSFTTDPAVNSAITAGSFTPINNARVNGGSLSELSFKLSKPGLLKGSGTIKLIASASNTPISSYITSSDPRVSLTSDASGTTVRLALTGVTLTTGTSYYVLVDKYAIRDTDFTTFGGISSGAIWSFSTEGTAVVPVPSVTPVNASANISPTGSLQLTFDRPMWPGGGQITVSPGSLTDSRARKVNVTSTQVTGGGSRTITVSPASSSSPLLYSTTYTVTVPPGAFKDQDDHLFPASGGSAYTWTFTTASSLQPLAPATLSPADGSDSVAVNRTFGITFNRNVIYDNSIANGVALYKSTGVQVPITVTPGSTAKDFVITMQGSTVLDNASTYYINILNGVFTDAADPLTVYSGLNGQTAWTFTTTAVDRTAPVLSSAVLDNNRTIRLKYNEPLDATTALLASSFPVTVNDEYRRVDSAVVSGDSVYITLSSGVAVGQVVKVGYSGGSRTIKDLNANAAATFALRLVSNNVDSALAAPKDGVVSGTMLTLNFNDSLKSVSPYAYSQFSVTSDGSYIGVNSISSSGSTVYLSLSSAPSNSGVVRVSYNAGSYPLQDTLGQNLSAFSNFNVRNSNDVVAPVLQTATGSGNKIVLTYNEGLSTTNLPVNNQFSVLAGSTVVYVTDAAVSGNQVTLTLQTALTVDQKVTVSYVPGTTGTSDLNNNRAGYINLQNVTMSGASAVAEISSATITGDTLSVNFNKSMVTTSSFSPSQFAVRADSSNLGVQSASVSGTQLKITLSSLVKTGQIIDLSYMAGTGTIKDLNGTALPSFTTLSVQNLTSSVAGGPSYLTTLATAEFGESIPMLKSDSANAVGDYSKSSQAINRYNLKADRLTGSYEYLSKLGTASLVFEVPQTESAAYVSVPLAPLSAAVNRNKKAEFAIRYGENLYSIELDKVDMSGLVRSLSADSSSISLLLRLEKVPTGTYTDLETKLQNNGLQKISSLVDYRLSAIANDNYSKPVDLTAAGEYSVRTTASLNEPQVSLARLDTTYQDAAYLPTTFTKVGSYTVLHAKTQGNQVMGAFLSIRSFNDMSKHWARTAVSELVTKNIIDSSYGSNYKPDLKITRGEFAVMLARGLGLQGSRETAQTFRDVQPSTQVGDYIGAAAKAGIILGNKDATFKPNANITREQMALMMIRAMEYTDHPITLKGTSATVLSVFKDKSKIQSDDFVAKAYQSGIILGVSAGVFQPQGNATRAQAAVMLQRMLNKADYL